MNIRDMFKRIIFPIDINSKNSWKHCLPTIKELTKNQQAKLYVMSVIPDYGMSLVQEYFPKGWVKEIVEKTTLELKKIVNESLTDEVEVEYIVQRGAVYQCIIDKANEIEADLIVIPAHRPELSDYLLGPNTAKIVRHAKISVLVMRD